MSLRRLEGWEPATVYEYEGGRLIRSVPESEWNAEQLAWLEALEEYEAGLCRCGEPLSESTRIEHDFNNPRGTGVYVPVEGTPVQCHACAALHRSEQATADLNPQHPGALIHAVRLVPRG